VTFRLYRLEEKARVLAALKANGSILLSGDEGSGKTVLMDAICDELRDEGYELAIVVVAIAVYALAYLGVIPRVVAHAIVIGHTFGYLMDLTTKSGIQLFFPATLRCVVPGNRKLRLSTGSNWEYGILAVVVALWLMVMSVNTRGGLASTFNEILATPRGIQEILSKHGSTRQIIAQVEGVRVIDRVRVSRRFGVLEQRDANTFIVYGLE
jgi:inner membrane protein